MRGRRRGARGVSRGRARRRGAAAATGRRLVVVGRSSARVSALRARSRGVGARPRVPARARRRAPRRSHQGGDRGGAARPRRLGHARGGRYSAMASERHLVHRPDARARGQAESGVGPAVLARRAAQRRAQGTPLQARDRPRCQGPPWLREPPRAVGRLVRRRPPRGRRPRRQRQRVPAPLALLPRRPAHTGRPGLRPRRPRERALPRAAPRPTPSRSTQRFPRRRRRGLSPRPPRRRRDRADRARTLSDER
mmetsp:Transcript_4842/g.15153  ORF Transcript_4842/g.15153 Transcript_4842/m.15153 type:complete len:252 (+) Transcript_4842:53-808(+)